MPHLSVQLSPQGPLIDVVVTVSKPREDALKKAGHLVPAAVQIRALVDTGASMTCVDTQVIQKLNLTPTGTTPMHTGSTAGTPHVCQQYDVGLVFPLTKIALAIPVASVSELQLHNVNFQALVGRDVLSRCLFVYDGTARVFMLSF